MAAARLQGDSSEVTYFRGLHEKRTWRRGVIATMRMVVRTEARIIFMGSRPRAARKQHEEG